MLSGMVVDLGREAGADCVRSICCRLEHGESDHQKLSPYRKLCQVRHRHAGGHRPWDVLLHRLLCRVVEGMAWVHGGCCPSLLSLFLSEVGVTVPELLSGLLENRKGTITTIHIDIGHIMLMFG